jgi:tryptophan synthase alpha chain
VNRIDRAFERCRGEGRAAVIVFVTGGDPDLETTAELIPELAAAGADVVEVGVPHSDPIAEGPTIQAASQRALAAGTTPARIVELIGRLRGVCDVPLVLMGYLNNVLARGEQRFAEDCAAAGVDGLIVADAPYEAARALHEACSAKGVHRILMVAPTSTPERLVQISARSRGFVYCVSVTGVTGERRSFDSGLPDLVRRIQRVTATPVAVGFGISTPEQAAEVAATADGIIVGSALVRRIGAAASRAEAIDSTTRFVRELARAVRGVSR